MYLNYALFYSRAGERMVNRQHFTPSKVETNHIRRKTILLTIGK